MASQTFTPVDYMGQPVGKSVIVAVAEEGIDESLPPKKTSVPKLLEWVGYDPDRAKAALVREHSASQPRSTLIEALEERLKEIS
jgi:hypothetical protein